jgi:hypothetical protein
MRVWTFEEAQENFDALLDAAELGLQKIVRGDQVFFVVSAEEWNRSTGVVSQ